MKLYDLELSGNCYKVRLFSALANIQIDIEPVDFMAGDHKKPPVIDLNPLGELPVLVDDDIILRDSQAILVYLAKKYGGHQWWPDGAAQQGEVMQWLSIAACEIRVGPNTARLVDKFGFEFDKKVALEHSKKILSILEQHLQSNDWLALARPTIADCAVFPYVGLAHEGGISLAEFPAINAWITRIKSLPNFIGMPAI